MLQSRKRHKTRPELLVLYMCSTKFKASFRLLITTGNNEHYEDVHSKNICENSYLRVFEHKNHLKTLRIIFSRRLDHQAMSKYATLNFRFHDK